MPVKLGSSGAEKVLEVALTDEETKLVQESGRAVKESITSLNI